MQKIAYLSLLFLLACPNAASASQIQRITLAELRAKADLIVMAKVTGLVKDGIRDHVTIQVGSYLKGDGPQTTYTFTLTTRGGLKDFDPALKTGDTGVFFLKRKDQKGQVQKAYWGSVATFQKNHFELAPRKKHRPENGDREPSPELGKSSAAAARSDRRASSSQMFPQRVHLKKPPTPWWRVLAQEGIQVRLTIDDDANRRHDGARIPLLLLEVRNKSGNRATISYRPSDLKLRLSDGSGKPVPRRRPPDSIPAPARRTAVVPPGDYVGFVPSRRAKTDIPSRMTMLDAGFDYRLLTPGRYLLHGSVTLAVHNGAARKGAAAKGTVEASLRHDHPKLLQPTKKVTLKLAPVEFVVPKKDAAGK